MLLFVNSKARHSGTIYDFDIHFDTSLFKVELGEYLRMSMVSFNCKHAFYNLEDDRNTSFTITEDGVEVTITLDEGNYDVDEIADMIASKLNTGVTNYTFVVTHNENTGKYTITPTLTGSGVTCVIGFSTVYDTHEIFGMEVGDYDITTAITSTSIASIGNEEALYLHTRTGKNIHYNGVNSSSNGSTLFAKIPILAPHFGQIYWEQMGGVKYAMVFDSGHHSNLMNFRVVNEYGLPIKLQSDYSMEFNLERI